MKKLGAVAATICVVGATGSGAASVPAGRIAFAVEEGRATRLYTIRPDGKGLTLVSRFRCCGISSETSPAWAPDGRTLAFVRSTFRGSDWQFEIHTRRIARGAQRVTRPGSRDLDFSPSWSPDGSVIVFDRDLADEDTRSIYIVAPNGTGLRRLTRGYEDDDAAWSPDGGRIAFARHPRNTFVYWPGKARLMLMNPDGSNPRAFPRGRGIAGREPAWSPDGRRLAFLSYRDRYGRSCDRERCYAHAEVYVVRNDGTGLRRLTRTRADEGGPTWSPDGRSVAFARGQRIMRVPAAGGRERLVVRMPDTVSDPDWRP